MTMPRMLTIIRHGQSESNLAKQAAEEGSPLQNEAELVSRHTSERRLTDRGITQAKAAGVWMRSYFEGRDEDLHDGRFYTSPYARAMETAGHLGLGVRWKIDPRLCERNWGNFDSMTYEERLRQFGAQLALRKTNAYFWRPGDGETMQDVYLRIRDHLGTLHRECSDKEVVEVLHGETMWAFLLILLYWTPGRLAEMMLKSDGDERIWIMNCRIIQFTRERGDGTLDDRLCRVRFVNPSAPDDPATNKDWSPIARPNFSDAELLASVERYPRFVTS